MSTIAELVDNVTGFYTRPDLEDRILAYAKTALYCAHKVDKFARDLSTVTLVNPTILEGKVTLSISLDVPRLRDVRSIDLFREYTGTTPNFIATESSKIIANPGYQNLNDLGSDTNYYGFRFEKLYSIAGTTLNLTGVDSATRAIRLSGLFLPTYILNTLTLLWETNSWIMIECPELVEAYMRIRACEIIADDKKLRAAQNN